MSIKVTYKNGIFEPLEDAKRARPGQNYTVFSDGELDEIRETIGWLKAAETSFDFGATRPMPCTTRRSVCCCSVNCLPDAWENRTVAA